MLFFSRYSHHYLSTEKSFFSCSICNNVQKTEFLSHSDFMQENKYFEDAFKVYERGVKIFKYPHVKDIWVTYLSKFVKRYGEKKLERARELFEHAVEKVHCSLNPPFHSCAK